MFSFCLLGATYGRVSVLVFLVATVGRSVRWSVCPWSVSFSARKEGVGAAYMRPIVIFRAEIFDLFKTAIFITSYVFGFVRGAREK